MATWVVVLVKDFDTAKSRLAPALPPAKRRELARDMARIALAAAAAGDRVLAVCGSPEAAELARAAGAEVILEAEPAGQNPAARRGVEAAVRGGAEAVLVMSSDLPLVTPEAVAAMLERGAAMGPRAVLAAAAAGRAGTNLVYMRPPAAIGFHFGHESLPAFAADAAARGVRFERLESPALALDLDEPADLAELERSG